MQEFRQGFVDMIHDIGVKAALSAMQGVIPEVERAKKLYGKMFAFEAIGVDQNPFNQGGYWKDLSDAWLKRKKATIGSPRFYLGLGNHGGHLGAALQAMPIEKLFGETQIKAALAVMQGAGFYNPRIKRQIDTVYRNAQGQFARAPKEPVPIRVVIRPFPGLRSDDDMLRQLPLDTSDKEKLRVNDTIRPVVKPFTDWFYKNKIEMTIRYALRNLRR